MLRNAKEVHFLLHLVYTISCSYPRIWFDPHCRNIKTQIQNLPHHIHPLMRRDQGTFCDFWAVGATPGSYPRVWPWASVYKRIDLVKSGNQLGIRRKLLLNRLPESAKHYRDMGLECRRDSISVFHSKKQNLLVRHTHIPFVLFWFDRKKNFRTN